MKKILFILTVIISIFSAPVVKKNVTDDEDPDEGILPNVEYSHYLKQVIDVLESDPEFKKKIEAMGNDSDVISVADHLDLVSHSVRTKLDELKRMEISRLNKLEGRLKVIEKGNKIMITRVDDDHLNIANEHNFEREDLKRLIAKTVEITNKLDAQAEEEFKKYEMEKEFKRKLRLSKIKSKEQRENLVLMEENARKRHMQHPAVHHPGSEEQLKEVWEKEDKLDTKYFNPVTFFRLHDTNEDGHLDIAEVEAVMQTELNKVYEGNNSDDDMVEMYNEMLRMRKEVFREADTNKDNMISYGEFIRWTKSEEFKKDNDWKTREELNETVFTKEDYEKFAKEFKETHAELNLTESNINKEFEEKAK